MTQPNDTLRKDLKAKLRKGYLLITGVLIVIALGFTFQDGIGSLFKGYLVGPGNPSGVGVDNGAGNLPLAGETIIVSEGTPGIGNYNFPPTVVKTMPIASAASTLPITAGFATVEFDEDDLVLTTQTAKVQIDSTAVPNTNTNLYDDTIGMTYVTASKTLKIPYKTLEYSKTYVVTVPKATIKTSQGTLLEADITWKFNTAATPQNVVTVICTENDRRSFDTEICQSNAWLKCDANLAVGKLITADGLMKCGNTNNVWSWATTATPPNNGNQGNQGSQGNTPSDSCSTENQTKNSDSYICKNSFWLRCSSATEGQKSTNNTKICTDSEWIPIPTAQSSNIKISKASVFPIGFNPLLAETKITYRISAKAKMEIKIIDGSGVKVRGLMTDETIDAGEHNITWDGAGDEGDVVSPGEYSFKITAKNPVSGEIADVKSGTINVVYYQAARDFENPAGSGNATTSPQSPATVQPLQPSRLEADATMALQNATSGTTAPTGPETLIYLVFPVLGYFLGRKK